MRLYWIFFIILGTIFVLYHPFLTVYFSHDDFFHFKVSQTDRTLGGFLNLFGFHPFSERGIAFYRPVFREALFNIFYGLFGLNHLPFRILSIAIHFVNVGLVYLLMQKLFQKRELALFVSFFFGITAANVGSLYYLAGGVQSLGVTSFVLLTLLSFWKWLEQGGKWYLLSFFAFILALGSHELAVVTPLLLLGLLFVQKRLKQDVKATIPFFIVLSVFLYLDFFLIGFSSAEAQYQPTLSLKTILNSLSWYSIWAFGIPEMFIDFVEPGFKLNPNLMKFWGSYTSGIFFFAGLAVTIFTASAVFVFRRAIKDRKFWFLLFWFPIALSPVLLLPLHKQTYYLTPALPAFWGAVGLVVFGAYSWLKERRGAMTKVLAGAFLLSLFLLSVISIALADKTYPAANRGRMAQKLVNEVKVKYPNLPKGAAVYFTNDPNYPKISGDWGGSSKQAAFILNKEDALQLLYKDKTLRVFYEDLGGVPKDFLQDKVYSLVARIQ